MRHLADEHLDGASAHARRHSHPYCVSVPAIRRRAELLQKVLPESALLLPLAARQEDPDPVEHWRVRIERTRLVEQTKRLDIGGEVSLAPEHVEDGLLFLGDSDGYLLELGVQRRPEGCQLSAKRFARGLATARRK